MLKNFGIWKLTNTPHESYDPRFTIVIASGFLDEILRTNCRGYHEVTVHESNEKELEEYLLSNYPLDRGDRLVLNFPKSPEVHYAESNESKLLFMSDLFKDRPIQYQGTKYFEGLEVEFLTPKHDGRINE